MKPNRKCHVCVAFTAGITKPYQHEHVTIKAWTYTKTCPKGGTTRTTVFLPSLSKAQVHRICAAGPVTTGVIES